MKCSEKNEFISKRWGGTTFKHWMGVLDAGSQGSGPTFTLCSFIS